MEFDSIDVLIVDDDEAIRLLLRRSLQRRGLLCAEARNGVEALLCLQKSNCSVILLDLTMPQLDGHGFVDAFMHVRQPQQSPVIFVMSAAGDDQLGRVRADAVHAVVRKPFDLHELADIVELCATSPWSRDARATG